VGPAPGIAQLWWLEEAPPDPEAPPLDEDTEADVAIVGGGFTGLWTALELKRREPGLAVTLLERDICGLGPSGRNGGFLHGFWASILRLRDVLDTDAAVAVAHASTGVYEAVRALGDDVWLRHAGYVKVSTTAAQDDGVERSVAGARALGAPQEAIPLSEHEVRARCDSPAFRRAVLFRDGATVQPARLVRALRRAVLRAGVQLHEQTAVTRVRSGLVATRRGRLRAREIVVATGHPPFRDRIAYFRSYVVLSEPVPERLEAIGWTGGEAIADARTFLHYFRTTADGRVLMGSAAGFAQAEDGLRRLLPGLGPVAIERRWDGPIDVSSDHLPFFGTRPRTRIHYGAGYTGSGVGASWVGGQVLASLVLDADDEWARLPLATRRVPRLPPQPLRALGGRLVKAAIVRSEDDDERGRRPPLAARALAALPEKLGLRIGTR
jgi:glycine/D-amino acid oxidase-like deaminating enzyme